MSEVTDPGVNTAQPDTTNVDSAAGTPPAESSVEETQNTSEQDTSFMDALNEELGNEVTEKTPTAKPEAETEDGEDKQKKKGADTRKAELQEEIDELNSQLDSEDDTNEQESNPTNSNREIRDMVAERNQLRRQVEDRFQQVPERQIPEIPSVEQLMSLKDDQGKYIFKDEATAKLERMELLQERDQVQQQLRQQTEHIAEVQYQFKSAAEQGVREFPEFDENSPQFNEGLFNQMNEIVENSLKFDEATGEIIGSTVNPYQLMQSLHQASQQGQKAVETRQKTAKRKMDQASEIPSSTPPPKPKAPSEGEKFMQAFKDELG